ncbi:MAG: class D sortase [Terriglobia bacterium]|nr:class D sortase [Terriglobia bacterium]
MSVYPHRRRRPVLHWAQLAFLALGVALLGYVGYSLLDSTLFQLYEHWRFDRAVNASRRAPIKEQPGVPLTIDSSPEEVGRATFTDGSVLGRIEIRRIGVSVIVMEGTDRRTLQRAVGHIAGTSLPGQPGNIAIAGHRDTFFRELRNLRLGDEITLTTLDGSLVYEVDSMKVVAADNTAVLNHSTRSDLTLVTCYPFYFVGPAPRRFVVHATAKVSTASGR